MPDLDDIFGAEAAAARVAARLQRVHPAAARLADDGRPLLSPPFSPTRDRFEGPASGDAQLVVFGAHGTPPAPALGRVLTAVREHHPSTVTVAWRHYPDPAAHPRAVLLALAVEAAAERGHFWALTRELLALHHDDPRDLHAAMLRAGVDPERAGETMRAETGADRIADDVASALASGVAYTPALFVNGARYLGALDPTAVAARLADVQLLTQ
jgi:hypothetical protein